jgi:hypothetical protein
MTVAMDWDPDYTLLMESGNAALRSAGASVRRAMAMYQWTSTRSDAEHRTAVQLLGEEGSDRRAWDVFRRRCAAGVTEVLRVGHGEFLVDAPLLADPMRGDAPQTVPDTAYGGLVAALRGVNTDDLIHRLQASDPLSWHCVSRSAQQHWYWNHRMCPDAGPVAPIPRRAPSPAPVRRPSYAEDEPGPRPPGQRRRGPPGTQHRVLRHMEPGLTVTFDVLEWPPRRTVRTPTTTQRRRARSLSPVHKRRRQSVPRSMSRTSKRRRHTCRMSEKPERMD